MYIMILRQNLTLRSLAKYNLNLKLTQALPKTGIYLTHLQLITRKIKAYNRYKKMAMGSLNYCD